jgi:hypothetical protein
MAGQGGAGTGGRTSRFYHLVFGARDGAGALRFDTYANHDEWTAESNGYLGLGTTSDGVTWWSLGDATWGRVVQWWASGTSFGTTGTLAAAPAYLLYPIHAADPTAGSAGLLLYAGEFDPSGGTNAGYLASSAFAGTTAGLAPLFRRAPPTPAPAGTVGAYPSDVAYGPDGTPYALSYLPLADGTCTELLRFDGGTGAAPTILRIGCVDTYAKLQVSPGGTLYVLAAAGGGAQLRLGVSPDRGATWAWRLVPITGLPDTGDASFFGVTPVKPYTAPGLYDAGRFEFLFAGSDGSALARHSYCGSIAIPE